MNHVTVTEISPWHHQNLGKIRRFVIENAMLRLEIISLGAIIQRFIVKNTHNHSHNIVLGCDNLDDYLSQNAYLGAIIGRFANRIEQGHIQHHKQHYQLDINQAPHCLHGGSVGFSHHNWQICEIKNGVRLSLKSPDGDMGFPGNCHTQVDYQLHNNQLIMEIIAKVDKPCPLSMTQHSYFNLNGEHTEQGIQNHHVKINADQYLKSDNSGIPKHIAAIKNNVFDLQKPTQLHEPLSDQSLKQTHGFDHFYLLKNGVTSLAAQLHSPLTGLTLSLYTDQPGLQFYTGNYLKGNPGFNDAIYQNHAGLCFEPSLVPNAPNDDFNTQTAWHDAKLPYHHKTIYQIDVTQR